MSVNVTMGSTTDSVIVQRREHQRRSPGLLVKRTKRPPSVLTRTAALAPTGLLCKHICMTTETAYPGDDPHRLLSNASELAQRVRKHQRATWFPLLVFAALTFASIPVRRYSGHHLDCRAMPDGEICRVYSAADFAYWPIATVLAYVAIVTFYIRRSRARGVGTRVLPYAVVGIIVAVALTALALWGTRNPIVVQNPTWLNGLPYRLVSPGGAIGLALLVLVWAERNRALLPLIVVYLAVVLVPVTFGRAPFAPPWYSLPVVSQGSVLLLGGIGFALAQRPLRSPAL
jgi:hypothetical protein